MKSMDFCWQIVGKSVSRLAQSQIIACFEFGLKRSPPDHRDDSVLSTPDQNPATRRSKTTPLTARVFEEVSVFFRLGALFEAVALAVHFQNVDMMGQSIEERTGETF